MPPVSKHVDITKTCTFLQLTLSRLGDKRGVSSDQIEVDADKDFVKVRKVIFKSPAFDAIRSHDGKIRRYVRDQCFPFEPGIHMVSLKKVEEVNEQLLIYFNERQPLVDHFAEVFPLMVENAPKLLRALYDKGDYRDFEIISTEFSMSWQFLMFTAPMELEQLNTDIFKSERRKLNERMEQAFEEARMVLREACLEMVTGLREALEPEAYGAPKRISSTRVMKLVNFVNNEFRLQNVTDDQELQKSVEQMKKLLTGVDVEELRQAGGLQARVHGELQLIEQALNSSLEVAPKRRIRQVAA